jgi:hypothetical protein
MFGQSDDSCEEAPLPSQELDRRDRSRSPLLPMKPVVSEPRTSESCGIEGQSVEEFRAAGESQARSIHWHDWLHEFKAPSKQKWGMQKRKVIVESMFTGMNPTAFCLAQGGLDLDDRVGAEEKSYAHEFMLHNNLLPARCYKDANDMMAAGLAPSQTGYVRADVFSAGFPCQPYSHGTRKKLEPTKHPLFKMSLLTFEYILLTRPRIALLENTSGFLQLADYFGTKRRGLDLLQDRLGMFYHIVWAKMNLTVWLDVARPRVYIWLIAKDVGTSADCIAIGEHIRLLECQRPRALCARVEDFMYELGSSQWRDKVHVALQCRGGSVNLRAATTTTIGEKKARDHLAPTTQIAAGRLWGLTGTMRQQAMYQALVETRCVAKRCAISDAAAVAEALAGFKWDFSQNVPARSRTGRDIDATDKTFLSLVRGPMSCQLRGSLPYSFQHDRLILPEEMLHSHGWQLGTIVPDCTGLTESELRDLVGEMQAVQTLSVVMWSILVVVGCQLPGLFAGAEV